MMDLSTAGRSASFFYPQLTTAEVHMVFKPQTPAPR